MIEIDIPDGISVTSSFIETLAAHVLAEMADPNYCVTATVDEGNRKLVIDWFAVD
jgi:hypothetical protein